VIERAVVFAIGPLITRDQIQLSTPVIEPNLGESFKDGKAKVIKEFEVRYLHSLLMTHDGNISRAARAADQNRRAFWEMLRRHNIDVKQFKHQPAI